MSVRYGVALETPFYPETVERRMIGPGYDQKVKEARNLLRQWEALGPYGMPGLEILVDMAGVKYGTIGHQYIMPEQFQGMNIPDQEPRDKEVREKEARDLEKDGWVIE